MAQPRFKSETLGLFFIVSLVPALFVAAVWYGYSRSTHADVLTLSFHSLVLPVMALGIIPALILSLLFAELLERPVKRLQEAVNEMLHGNYAPQGLDNLPEGEFTDIAATLREVGHRLEQTISEASSETELIGAERNKLRGVLNSMTDGVFALDSDGRIILFNKAASELTGRTIESVAGQLAEKVMPFRSHGELVMTRWLAEQAGKEQRLGEWKNLELYRADGSSLFVNVQAVVLHEDPNGIRALVTFHDLTKGHQLEEMKIDFTALAAHELRTPLTELRGYLDILESEGRNLSADRKQLIGQATRSANELNHILNSLLGVARIEHGESTYDIQPLDYRAYLAELADELTARATRAKRTFKLKLPARLPLVAADGQAIKEVINNLFNNAIIYTPDNGHIELTVRQVDKEIETTVTDNGQGIPAQAVPNLFTKFYRAGEMKARTRGTGLGLYISKSIIEAHHGHIWVESVQGKGSTFGFRLPLARDMAASTKKVKVGSTGGAKVS